MSKIVKSGSNKAGPGKSGLSMGVMVALGVAIAVACGFGKAHAESVKFPDAAHERFSVTVTGTGPDVILIPGLASSGAVWDQTVAKFKGQYRLHVLNLAGFAGEPAGANASGEILTPSVEALDAYIKANHLKTPTVVGHSMGGLMTLMLAKAHPEDAGKLIIVDALPYVGVIFNPAATVEAMKPTATAMRGGIEQASADGFKAQQQASTGRMTAAPANQKLVLDWSMTSNRHVFAQAFYEDLTTDLRPDVAAIKTPTVLFYPLYAAAGQTAEMIEPVYKTSYAGMPNFSMVRIDNSLHFEMLDQPEAFAKALGDALK